MSKARSFKTYRLCLRVFTAQSLGLGFRVVVLGRRPGFWVYVRVEGVGCSKDSRYRAQPILQRVLGQFSGLPRPRFLS